MNLHHRDELAPATAHPRLAGIVVTITNKGRGSTIEQCRCEYESPSGDGVRGVTITAHVGDYIEKGKACEGRLKIYSKPIR